MDAEGQCESAIPRRRIRASEAASETAFALLDGLWHGPVGVAVLDGARRFVQVNDPFAALSGATPAAHDGRTFSEIAERAEGPAREDLGRLDDACRTVADLGQPFLNLLVRGASQEGSAREWLCSVLPDRRAGRERARAARHRE